MTLALTNEAIVHWRKLRTGEHTGIGIDACALCRAYYVGVVNCVKCPIYLYSGQLVCSATPYVQVSQHINHKHNGNIDPECEQCQFVIDREIDFLLVVREAIYGVPKDSPAMEAGA